MIWSSLVLPHASTMTLAMVFGPYVLDAHTSEHFRAGEILICCHIHIFTQPLKHVGLDCNNLESS